MKKVLLMALAAFALQATAAQAAVNLSRHDMGAMGSAFSAVAGSYGDCSACHVPHKAAGAKLWAKTPPAYDASFAVTGPLCARCHDGVVITGNTSANLNYGPYRTPTTGLQGHRMNITLTPSRPDGTSAVADVRGTTLPHVDATNNPTYMECTSCHDVHAPGNRPFIAGGYNINNVCTVCHLGRENSAYGLLNPGLHPVNVGGTINIADMAQGGANPIVNAMIAKAAGTGLATDTPWNSGPHAGINAASLYCTSCHVVHGDEPTGYSEDGTALQGIYDASLLISPQNGSPDPASLGGSIAPLRNSFCEYCHQGVSAATETANTFPNPGGVSGLVNARGYHPADSGLNNGTGRIVAITSPAGWPFLTGGLVACNSCHSAHGSTAAGTINLANAPILRDPLPAGGSFCMSCHDATNSAFDCFHAGHIAGDGSGGSYTAMPKVGMGSPWGTAPANGLDCNACHRAHNAPYSPLLRIQFGATAGDPDAICTTCHTVNPSTYTTAAPMGAAQSTASHFMGSPTVAGGSGTVWEAAGYGVQNANMLPERTVAWTTTMSSIYGTGNAMTCLSCHSMRYCGDGGAAIDATGDNDGDTYMVITASGNRINQPAGDEVSGGASYQANVNNTTGSYLCSGCHTNDPVTVITGSETGFTHPLGDATSGVADQKTNTTMSKTANGTVNCESCHRAHDADLNSGTYILESDNAGSLVTGTGTAQTIAPAHVHDTFCNGCHSM